jgi:hypothetical protein
MPHIVNVVGQGLSLPAVRRGNLYLEIEAHVELDLTSPPVQCSRSEIR